MKLKMLAGVAVLALIGAGVASAAIPDSSTGVITGCYQTSGGTLRVINKQGGGACYAWETELPWNQTGPAGANGATGATGATGPQGPAGANGVSAAFEQVQASGWDATQYPAGMGLWTRTLSCPAGKSVIAAYGSASSANSFGGQGFDTLALGIDQDGIPQGGVLFGVVKVSGMAPYVLYELTITCVTTSLIS